MNGPNGEPEWVPSAALLAAYADGEVANAGLRERLEAWLAANPEAAETVQNQQHLTECMQLTVALDPGEAAWTSVSERLQALPLPQPGLGRRWLWLAAGAATAACLGLAVTLGGLGQSGEDDLTVPLPAVSKAASGEADDLVLPVATAAEVEILSVQGDDTATLVVGELPVEGTLPLLGSRDFSITHMEPDRDNMLPEIRSGDASPVIYAPLDVERANP